MKGERLCAGHLGLGMAANPSAYAGVAGAVSAEVRRETAEVRPRTYRGALAAEWERHAETIVARRMAIIRNGTDADAERTIQAMEARIYGRPTEHTEVEVKEPGTGAELRGMTNAEIHAWIRKRREQEH